MTASTTQDSAQPRSFVRLGGLLGWVAFASALGGTFWLYMRPDFMLDVGAFLAFCGIAL
jgi:hypothetical protein